MCTVSFIPMGNGAILTSNRDEKLVRGAALAPAAHQHGTGIITYPKDTQAGGTWFAIHQNGNAAVLLNGAFEKHKSNPPYLKSRGIVLLEILDSEYPLETFRQMHMEASTAEPFTLILWQNQALYQCCWNGVQKNWEQKNAAKPHIWSSVTLYDAAVREKRAGWFWQWLQNNPAPEHDKIIAFHFFGGNGNTENDLVMSRDNTLCTVSITSAMLAPEKAIIRHHDLVQKVNNEKEVLFTQTMVCI